ncbi:MAG TPA: hypothetical protein VHX87_06010 [Galbitalea sp.]|nr:hypothetical protein [Galbitalea sp.]
MKLVTRSAVAIAAAVALATIALTGCSPSPAPTTPPKPVNPPPEATYTDGDLVKILTAANTSLNAGGSVTDLGVLASQTYAPTKDVYGRVLAQGGTFTPAACGQLFTKIGQDVATLGGTTGAYAARLDYGTSILSATSSSNPVDVATLTSLVSGDLTALTTQCATAQIGLHGLTASFAFKTEDATTDAATTWAYSETGSVGSATLGSVAVVALDGNLLIGYEGANSADTVADGVTAINAVVAAAKSNNG